MSDVEAEHVWNQLIAAAESDEPDPELFLDACSIIHEQAEENRRLQNIIANLKAENATLKQYGFYE
jgi:hypothetical protein